jgi:hypothetical protein
MGVWRLVLMKARPKQQRASWLLIRSRDVGARLRWAPDILVEQPLSVISVPPSKRLPQRMMDRGPGVTRARRLQAL